MSKEIEYNEDDPMSWLIELLDSCPKHMSVNLQLLQKDAAQASALLKIGLASEGNEDKIISLQEELKKAAERHSELERKYLEVLEDYWLLSKSVLSKPDK